MSRTDEREGFPDDVRIRLLERDMDQVAEGLDGVRKLLQAILVSTATASILLAINLVVGSVGGP